MKELLPDIDRWREAGKKVAIATVVQAYGSAPRRPGAKSLSCSLPEDHSDQRVPIESKIRRLRCRSC